MLDNNHGGQGHQTFLNFGTLPILITGEAEHFKFEIWYVY